MTVSSDLSRGSYVANSGPFVFPVPFYFLESSHIRVVRRTSGGTETELTEGVEFDVSGAGDLAGGSVTIKAGHEPAATDRIVIVRNVPITQETDYVENDAFTAETHERALDKLTMINQQQTEELGRAIKLPISTSVADINFPEPVGDALIKWNSGGTSLETAALASLPSDIDLVLSEPVSGQMLRWNGTRFVNVSPGLVDLADVDLAGDPPDAGDLFRYDGSNFVPATPAEAGLLSQGLHAVYLPAAAWRPQATNGCAGLAETESASNQVMTAYLAFDADAVEHAQVSFKLPPSIDGTAAISGYVEWKEAPGGSARNVHWTIQCQAQGDGDAIDSAWGDASAASDTDGSPATGERRVVPFSGLLAGGSPAPGDTLLLRVQRVATDAGDTCDVDARLIGIMLFLTVNDADDS